MTPLLQHLLKHLAHTSLDDGKRKEAQKKRDIRYRPEEEELWEQQPVEEEQADVWCDAVPLQEAAVVSEPPSAAEKQRHQRPEVRDEISGSDTSAVTKREKPEAVLVPLAEAKQATIRQREKTEDELFVQVVGETKESPAASQQTAASRPRTRLQTSTEASEETEALEGITVGPREVEASSVRKQSEVETKADVTSEETAESSSVTPGEIGSRKAAEVPAGGAGTKTIPTAVKTQVKPDSSEYGRTAPEEAPAAAQKAAERKPEAKVKPEQAFNADLQEAAEKQDGEFESVPVTHKAEAFPRRGASGGGSVQLAAPVEPDDTQRTRSEKPSGGTREKSLYS